jgi:hypothetical protein
VSWYVTDADYDGVQHDDFNGSVMDRAGCNERGHDFDDIACRNCGMPR